MFDQRFSRQYDYEPPPGFRLASPYTSIVRNLSGLKVCAPAPVPRTCLGMGRRCTRCPQAEGSRRFRFRFAFGFVTLKLAHNLNSLVRVSRRVGDYPLTATIGARDMTRNVPTKADKHLGCKPTSARNQAGRAELAPCKCPPSTPRMQTASG
jgi:hypothetical protein